MVLLLLDMKNAFGITKKTLHPAFALRDEAPLKIQLRSTVPPELRAAARHSLCCNGRTRQGFASALCGGRSPAHGRLLAARPSGRQPSLRHGERDFGLSASSFWDI